MPLTSREVEDIATRAADKAARSVSLGPDEVRDLVSHAVTQTLLQLGVDAANPMEMQRDFQHLRSWRTAQAELRAKGMVALLGIVFSGFVALCLLGVREWFRGK